MARALGILVLFALPFAVGCSNAPIAGTLDCLFPNRSRPSPTVPDLGRERDRDAEPLTVPPRDRRAPLPPAEPYPFEDPRRGGSGSGSGGTPRLGDPLRRSTEPVPRDDDLPLLLPPPRSPDGRDLRDALPPPTGGR